MARAFWGWAQAGAHDVWPMGMSHVPWHVLCPMSHGPVLCPVALSYVLWSVLLLGWKLTLRWKMCKYRHYQAGKHDLGCNNFQRSRN